MALPIFFRRTVDVITGVENIIYQWAYIFDADGSLALFDRDETPPEGWRLLTDAEWDILFPPPEQPPVEPPVDPEPQE